MSSDDYAKQTSPFLRSEFDAPRHPLAAVITVLDRIVDQPNRARRGLAVLAAQLRDDRWQSFALAALRRHQLQQQIARTVAATGARDSDPTSDELADGHRK